MIQKNMAALYDSTVASIPLGRMGSADEVAAQVALLASPRAGFTSGTIKGLSKSVRNCDELSITVHPLETAMGAYFSAVSAPAEKKAISTCEKSNSSMS